MFTCFTDLLPELQEKIVSFTDLTTMDNFAVASKITHDISTNYKQSVLTRVTNMKTFLMLSHQDITNYMWMDKHIHKAIMNNLKKITEMNTADYMRCVYPELSQNKSLHIFILSLLTQEQRCNLEYEYIFTESRASRDQRAAQYEA